MSSPDSPSDRLRLAIQKSGRLSTDSLDLLARCGIKIKASQGKLLIHSDNFPVDVLFVRDDDIPRLVIEGVCDLGIVGGNVLEEVVLERRAAGGEHACTIECSLDFGGCRLVMALPDERPYAGPADLAGMRIATTYPQLTRRFCVERGIPAELVVIGGSVEIAPRLGLADAVCDLVSTGSTLEANRLRAVETVFQSTATLIRSAGGLTPEKSRALAILLRRIDGVQRAAEAKYIMLHAPVSSLAEITRLLPGARSPTLLPVADDDTTVAFHAVCREAVFWETLESLREAGARDILVLPIEKLMC